MLTDDEYTDALIAGHTAGLLAQAAEWLHKLAGSADHAADRATALSVAQQCAAEVRRSLAAEAEAEADSGCTTTTTLPGPIWWEIHCRDCGATHDVHDVAKPHVCPECGGHNTSAE